MFSLQVKTTEDVLQVGFVKSGVHIKTANNYKKHCVVQRGL